MKETSFRKANRKCEGSFEELIDRSNKYKKTLSCNKSIYRDKNRILTPLKYLSNSRFNDLSLKNRNSFENERSSKVYLSNIKPNFYPSNRNSSKTKYFACLNKTMDYFKKNEKNLRSHIFNPSKYLHNNEFINTKIISRKEEVTVEELKQFKKRNNELENEERDEVLTVIENDCENDYTNIFNCLKLNNNFN